MNPAKLCAIPLAAFLALAPQNARAQECGMGPVDWYGAERASVARADELLESGEPQKAAALLQQMWPRLREATPVAGSLPVIADGVRVMALAAVRADGDVPSQLGWSSRTAGERAGNVAWGVKRLRMLVGTNPGDAVMKTALGEALARAMATREEGATMLESLAAMDMMTSPEGYAALALVRSEHGDIAGAEVASTMCRRRASNIDTQCIAAGARVTPAVTATR